MFATNQQGTLCLEITTHVWRVVYGDYGDEHFAEGNLSPKDGQKETARDRSVLRQISSADQFTPTAVCKV